MSHFHYFSQESNFRTAEINSIWVYVQDPWWFAI